MAKINFVIQSAKNPATIYIRLHDGKKVNLKVPLEKYINPKNWEAGLMAINGRKKKIKYKEAGLTPSYLKDSDGKKLNGDLQNYKTRLLIHYNSCTNKDLATAEWLKDFIESIDYPDRAKSIIANVPNKLIQYFEYYIKHKKIEKKAGSTIIKLNSVKSLVERFQTYSKKQYYIKDVDSTFKLNFIEYCEMQKYASNTINRSVRFIKAICTHAKNNGIETSFQLNNIKAKEEPTSKIYLNFDEIKKIAAVKLEQDYLVNSRDWLLISCELAQRVSDLLRFDKSMIVYLKTPQGKKPFIEFKQKKTGKLMQLPLGKKVLDILKKRGGEFPRKITSQRYNEYIKEVCKKAGLNEMIEGSKHDNETNRQITGIFPKWELVSSHLGRKSFATNYYGKKPIHFLMYMTGHTTEKMFRRYINKSDNEAAIEASKYA